MSEGIRKLTPEQIEEARRKRVLSLGVQIEKAKGQTSKERQEEVQALVSTNLQETKQKLQEREFDLTEEQEKVLELKLTRCFQNENSLDLNTFTDAIVKSPKWLNKPKGSIETLLDTYKNKVVQEKSEIQRRVSERTDEGFNPREALFQTYSKEHYLASLKNMPHLNQESNELDHCVGESTFYISRIKDKEIEILFFRATPKINKETQKLEGDKPLATIEYNLKEKRIEQIKIADDEDITKDVPYFNDFLEVLDRLGETTFENRSGDEERREIESVNGYVFENVDVAENSVLTTKGEVSLKEVDLNSFDAIVLKTNFEVTEETTKEDFEKIIQISNKPVVIESEKIAQKFFDGSIKQCDVDLEFNSEKLQGVILPEVLNGKVLMNNLQTAEGVVFPKTLNGRLVFKNLQTAVGLVLPEILNGSLFLGNLQTTENLVLPKVLNGGIDLGSIKSGFNLVLPETLNGSLYLNSIQIVEGLILPRKVDGNIGLNSLKTAKGLVFPEIINGNLDLTGLETIDGLELSENIDGYIYFKQLEETQQEKLKEKYPQYIDKFIFD